MAPEYVVLGHMSVKLDVYSFGVLVLEIVTGRKNTEMFESAVDESTTLLSFVSLPINHHLPKCNKIMGTQLMLVTLLYCYQVWEHWQKETPLETMDPLLDCNNTETEVLKCIHLGLLCLQENPADRPTMLDVLVMLHGHASSFPAPSKPAFTFAYGEFSSDSVPRVLGTQRAEPVPSVNGMSVSEFQPR
jgi:serine/threonine protein kinase